jgi:hypothetical protein
MKLNILLCLALVLCGVLSGCSTTARRQGAELTWPEGRNGLPFSEGNESVTIIGKRFARASRQALGGEDDIAAIGKTIELNDSRQKLRVSGLRWL